MFNSQEGPRDGTIVRLDEPLLLLSSKSAAWFIINTAEPDILASHLNLLTISACLLLF